MVGQTDRELEDGQRDYTWTDRLAQGQTVI
jgi:hypothetical protein